VSESERKVKRYCHQPLDQPWAHLFSPGSLRFTYPCSLLFSPGYCFWFLTHPNFFGF
jgi:hypothetical protein